MYLEQYKDHINTWYKGNFTPARIAERLWSDFRLKVAPDTVCRGIKEWDIPYRLTLDQCKDRIGAWHKERWTSEQVIQKLWRECQVKVSTTTLCRRERKWGFPPRKSGISPISLESQRGIITAWCLEHLSNSQISQKLWSDFQIKVSAATVRLRTIEWGILRSYNVSSKEQRDLIKARIAFYYYKDCSDFEIHEALKEEGFDDLSMPKLQKYRRERGLLRERVGDTEEVAMSQMEDQIRQHVDARQYLHIFIKRPGTANQLLNNLPLNVLITKQFSCALFFRVSRLTLRAGQMSPFSYVNRTTARKYHIATWTHKR